MVEIVVAIQPNQLRRYATVRENNVIDLAGRETGRDALTELLRNDARTLIAQALVAELGDCWNCSRAVRTRRYAHWWCVMGTRRNASFRPALVL